MSIAYHLGIVFSGGIFGLIGKLSYQYISDIKAIPNFLCAFLVFLYFLLRKEKTNWAINKVASITLSVYIAHQVPAFISYEWGTIFRSAVFKGMEFNAWYPLIVVCVIFIVVYFIDTFIRKPLESIWQQTRLFDWIENKLDNIYENVGL